MKKKQLITNNENIKERSYSALPFPPLKQWSP